MNGYDRRTLVLVAIAFAVASAIAVSLVLMPRSGESNVHGGGMTPGAPSFSRVERQLEET